MARKVVHTLKGGGRFTEYVQNEKEIRLAASADLLDEVYELAQAHKALKAEVQLLRQKVYGQEMAGMAKVEEPLLIEKKYQRVKGRIERSRAGRNTR